MSYGFLIESMVSILLLLTILYCVRLNNQLRLRPKHSLSLSGIGSLIHLERFQTSRPRRRRTFHERVLRGPRAE